MQKIHELIKKLCPNGVEYKNIQELCKISRGKVMSKDFIKSNAGEYPVYSSQTENNGELGKISTYDFDGEYLTWTTDGANAGSVFYRKGKFSVTNVCGLLEIKSKVMITKFLYYVLSIEAPKYVNAGMGNPKLMSNVMAKIRVAVPPLEVQCEIVHILDDFTELSAELSAELKARQKQYEYYMDKIFNNATQTKMVKLSNVLVSLKTGLNPRKFFQLNTPDANGYYVTVRELGDRNVRYWESKDRINQIGLSRINERSNLEINDVLFSGTGTIGRVSIIEEKPEDWNVKEGVYILKPKIDLINPVFLMYLMKSNYMRNIYSNYIVGSPVSSVPMKDLKNVEFDLPSIEEQEKIVRILDRFDQLCTDISEGLPAEIEARQKQYEYYRDKLLTFKELKVNE